MSSGTIQQVVNALQDLPESDREQVLAFLGALKRKQETIPATQTTSQNPALAMKHGRLVFTGEIGDSNIDWLKVVREERADEILRQALGTAEPL